MASTRAAPELASRLCATNSNTAVICSRVTSKCSITSATLESSRFWITVATGSRVPLNTHAPLTRPGTLSTTGHCDQSRIAILFQDTRQGLHVLGYEEQQPEDEDRDQSHGDIEQRAAGPRLAALFPVGEFLALGDADLLGMLEVPDKLLGALVAIGRFAFQSAV